MLILAIWYRWLEKPILSLLQLPNGTRHKSPVVFTLSLSVGVLVGALTHVVWDASSHATGWLVQQYYWLRIDALGLPVYKWNQYLGGILGLAALAGWYYVARGKTDRRRPTPKQYRIASGTILAPVVVFVCVANLVHDSETFREIVVHSAVGVLTGLTLGSFIYAAWANREDRETV